jgi:hypothetical protein
VVAPATVGGRARPVVPDFRQFRTEATSGLQHVDLKNHLSNSPLGLGGLVAVPSAAS